jgi:hypothetical protein
MNGLFDNNIQSYEIDFKCQFGDGDSVTKIYNILTKI